MKIVFDDLGLFYGNGIFGIAVFAVQALGAR
jgi:hypothetical protein